MIYRFAVQGSAEEPYHVAIERIGDNLRASCTCPAGENGQYCKHRFRLLGGDDTGVVSGDIEAIGSLPNLLRGTDVEAAIQKLVEAEEKAERAKRALSAAKKAVAAAMRS